MPRCVGLVVVLAASACAHRAADPVRAARTVVHRAADAMRRGDIRGVDRLLVRPKAGLAADRERYLRSLGADGEAAAADLDTAAAGTAEVQTRVRLRGELDTEVLLVHTPEGWRVDPETVGLPCPTPVAALEHLILALERMDTDPALALLSASLRDSIVQATAERVAGLREALPRVPDRPGDQLQLRLDYGHGLFVLLRAEAGQWRIDDFN